MNLRNALSMLAVLMTFIVSFTPVIIFADGQASGYYKVSTSAAGLTGDGTGSVNREEFVSSDGRFVAFRSESTNLISDDTNGNPDIFRKDTLSGEIVRVNLDTNGRQVSSSDNTRTYDISANGAKVLFGTDTPMVPEDTNSIFDIYIKDLSSNSIARVSVGDMGQQCNSECRAAKMSEDGKYAMFISSSTSLVVGVNTYERRIYLRDIQNNITQVLSTQAQGEIYTNDMSADGRYVVYSDTYQTVVNGSSLNRTDTWVLDRETSQATRANISSEGELSNGYSNEPRISSNGRYITFFSNATNLVSNDTNGYVDVFVHDMITGFTDRVSVATNGDQTNQGSYLSQVSDDGRYIVFESEAYNLIPGAQYTGKAIVYIHDRQNHVTRKVTPSSFTDNISSYGGLTITPDGKYIVFEAGPSIYKVSVLAIFTDDYLAPIITGVPDRSSNSNGWFNAPVTISWSAMDPTPSSGAPIVPAQTPANIEGTNTYISSQSCDPVGNCATGSLALSIDTVLPGGTFTGGTTVVKLLGQHINGTATDITSGIDTVEIASGLTTLSSATGTITLTCNNVARTNCTWDANPGSLPVGSQTLTLKVIDKAGNLFTTTKSYTVI